MIVPLAIAPTVVVTPPPMTVPTETTLRVTVPAVIEAPMTAQAPHGSGLSMSHHTDPGSDNQKSLSAPYGEMMIRGMTTNYDPAALCLTYTTTLPYHSPREMGAPPAQRHSTSSARALYARPRAALDGTTAIPIKHPRKSDERSFNGLASVSSRLQCSDLFSCSYWLEQSTGYFVSPACAPKQVTVCSI